MSVKNLKDTGNVQHIKLPETCDPILKFKLGNTLYVNTNFKSGNVVQKYKDKDDEAGQLVSKGLELIQKKTGEPLHPDVIKCSLDMIEYRHNNGNMSEHMYKAFKAELYKRLELQKGGCSL